MPASSADSPHARWTGQRREFLRFGLTGVAGLTLPRLFQLRAIAAPPPKTERTAIILVFLHGGASHLETYDPKPLAPAEYRGPYGVIDTKVPGLQLCELLPRHAASPSVSRFCARWCIRASVMGLDSSKCSPAR